MLIIRYRITAFFLALSMLPAMSVKANALSEPAVSAEACVVMSSDGECLFEKDAHTHRLIASTTKLMTAIVCIENCDLDSVVPINIEHCNVEGSSMYLDGSYTYTVKELLLGLLLASGNDAAVAVAEYTSGSEKAFVRLMNRKAQELGMNDTSFDNPHGLDSKTHYSTAKDMARLMLYCMENDTFRDLISTYSATINGISYVNHNKLLVTCPGCIGGKTGYTMSAGRCLVTCCERGGLRLVCVTLSAPDDWRDHTELYDWAYKNFSMKEYSDLISFDVPVVTGNREKISVVPTDKIKLLTAADDSVEICAELPEFVFAPISLGEPAGRVIVLVNGVKRAECPLVFSDNVLLAFPCYYARSVEVIV